MQVESCMFNIYNVFLLGFFSLTTVDMTLGRPISSVTLNNALLFNGQPLWPN